MNRNDFNRFISGGALPGPGDLEGIRELTDLFPWFHAAHLVLLRGLKENADVRFESQLRSSALSVSDREVLYHYLFMHPAEPEIEAEVEAVTEVTEEPDAETSQLQEAEAESVMIHEAESAVESVVIHEAEAQVETEPEPETEPVPDAEPEVFSAAAAVTAVVTTREELIAEIEARLAEMASASATVLELDHASQPEPEQEHESEFVPEPEPEQPAESVEPPSDEEELLEFIGDEEPLTPEPEQKLTPSDLIDRFIMTSPRIERMTPAAEQPVKDLAEPSAEEQGTFITETLARIYVNQGYYFKAINIYEKLSLKYPEKSAYFASRIEKIKELIK